MVVLRKRSDTNAMFEFVAATEMIRDNLKPKYTRRLEMEFLKDTTPDILLSVYDGGLDEEDEDGRPRGRLIGSAKYTFEELLGKHNGLKRVHKVLKNSKNDKIDKRLRRNHSSLWVKIIPPMPDELVKKQEWEADLREPHDLSDDEYEKYRRRRRRRKRRRDEKRTIKGFREKELHLENQQRLAQLAISGCADDTNIEGLQGQVEGQQSVDPDEIRQYYSDSPDESKELYQSSRVRISTKHYDYPQMMKQLSFNGRSSKNKVVSDRPTESTATTRNSSASTEPQPAQKADSPKLAESSRVKSNSSSRLRESILDDKEFSWFDDDKRDTHTSKKSDVFEEWFET